MFEKSWQPNEVIEITGQAHKKNMRQSIGQSTSDVDIVLVPKKSNLIKEKRKI
jgi:hypothetical protein